MEKQNSFGFDPENLSESNSQVEKIEHFINSDIGSLKEEEVEKLIGEISVDADNFVSFFEVDPGMHTVSSEMRITNEEEAIFDRWVDSEEGKNVIAKLSLSIISLLKNIAMQGLPGHDKRHILFKDPIAGLRFIEEDRISGYKQLFLLGSLFHDFGRLIEQQFYGKHLNGVLGEVHPKISYYFLKQILKDFPEIPAKLRDHILYSVVIHQTGKGDSFFAQAVQRCDREQLIGAEGPMRILSAAIEEGNMSLVAPIQERRKRELSLPAKPVDLTLPEEIRDLPDSEIPHRIEFYMRNLYPNVGSRGEIDASENKIISGIFLLISSTQPIREQIFAPEYARDNGLTETLQLRFKKPMSEESWRSIKTLIQNDHELSLEIFRTMEGKSCDALILEMISACGASVTEKQREFILKEVEQMSDYEKTCYSYGCAYVICIRKREDKKDTDLLERTKAIYDPESLPYKVAEYIFEEMTV